MTDDQLAREIEFKQANLLIAQKQLALAEAQFDWQKKQAQRKWGNRLTPTGVVFVGFVAGLIGTAEGKIVDYYASQPQQRTTIILKASELRPGLSPDEQETQRASNILWFVEMGAIDFSAACISQLQKAAGNQLDQTPSPSPMASQPSNLAYNCRDRP